MLANSFFTPWPGNATVKIRSPADDSQLTMVPWPHTRWYTLSPGRQSCAAPAPAAAGALAPAPGTRRAPAGARSEERRVGNECRCWAAGRYPTRRGRAVGDGHGVGVEGS